MTASGQAQHSIGKIGRHLASFAVGIALTTLVAQPGQAQTYRVIHTFTNAADGGNPFAGLTIDKAGNLYGTAAYGGYFGGNCYAGGCGTAFKLAPRGSGWIFTTLYTFQDQSDGGNPEARLILGPDGSLYGTTIFGDTVVNLKPPPTRPVSAFGPWLEKTLYQFNGGSEGVFPEGDQVFDQAGNLYGGVFAGGSGDCYDGCGNVYMLTPSNGGWIRTSVYDFQGPNDGGGPNGVVFGKDGNLYGTTFRDGPYGDGTVFQLTPSGSGWTETTLHSFQYDDGINPGAGLISDAAGNFYGSTTTGPGYSGTIFELSPSNGGWTYTVLYHLPSQYEGGPAAVLAMDAAGNLYGTIKGYCEYCWGAVFKLSPGSGGWTFTSLHDFNGSDGGHPYSNVVFDAQGNFYGTASNGGPYNYECQYQSCGVVWEITP